MGKGSQFEWAAGVCAKGGTEEARHARWLLPLVQRWVLLLLNPCRWPPAMHLPGGSHCAAEEALPPSGGSGAGGRGIAQLGLLRSPGVCERGAS